MPAKNVQLNVNNNRYHLRISERLYLHVCEYLTLQAVDTRPRAWFHKSKMRLRRHAWGHLICQAVDTRPRAVGRGNRWPLYSEAQQGHGIKGPAFFCRLAEESWASRHCAKAFSSSSFVSKVEWRARVSVCSPSSFSMNHRRMRNMSDLRPSTKSCHGGRFLKAVIAKFSERVKATNGRPCLEAGLKRLLPTR